MDKMDSKSLEKRLSGVKDTSDDIQALSRWCLQHKNHHHSIVQAWSRSVRKAKLGHRLTLFYVCNDIVQNARRKKCLDLVQYFGTAVKEAVPLVRDEKIRKKIQRIFKIWEERGIYDSKLTAEFMETIENVGTVNASENDIVLSSFQLVKLVEGIRNLIKLEKTSQSILADLKTQEYLLTEDEINKLQTTVKERGTSRERLEEFEDAVMGLECYIASTQKEIEERTRVVTLLEQAEIFYETQRGEAKLVANAYRNFSNQVKSLKTKLTEVMKTLPEPSPVSIPTSDVPSPQGSCDSIEILDEEIAIVEANKKENSKHDFDSFMDSSFSLSIKDIFGETSAKDSYNDKGKHHWESREPRRRNSSSAGYSPSPLDSHSSKGHSPPLSGYSHRESRLSSSKIYDMTKNHESKRHRSTSRERELNKEQMEFELQLSKITSAAKSFGDSSYKEPKPMSAQELLDTFGKSYSKPSQPVPHTAVSTPTTAVPPSHMPIMPPLPPLPMHLPSSIPPPHHPPSIPPPPISNNTLMPTSIPPPINSSGHHQPSILPIPLPPPKPPTHLMPIEPPPYPQPPNSPPKISFPPPPPTYPPPPNTTSNLLNTKSTWSLEPPTVWNQPPPPPPPLPPPPPEVDMGEPYQTSDWEDDFDEVEEEDNRNWGELPGTEELQALEGTVAPSLTVGDTNTNSKPFFSSILPPPPPPIPPIFADGMGRGRHLVSIEAKDENYPKRQKTPFDYPCYDYRSLAQEPSQQSARDPPLASLSAPLASLFSGGDTDMRTKKLLPKQGGISQSLDSGSDMDISDSDSSAAIEDDQRRGRKRGLSGSRRLSKSMHLEDKKSVVSPDSVRKEDRSPPFSSAGERSPSYSSHKPVSFSLRPSRNIIPLTGPEEEDEEKPKVRLPLLHEDESNGLKRRSSGTFDSESKPKEVSSPEEGKFEEKKDENDDDDTNYDEEDDDDDDEWLFNDQEPQILDDITKALKILRDMPSSKIDSTPKIDSKITSNTSTIDEESPSNATNINREVPTSIPKFDKDAPSSIPKVNAEISSGMAMIDNDKSADSKDKSDYQAKKTEINFNKDASSNPETTVVEKKSNSISDKDKSSKTENGQREGYLNKRLSSPDIDKRKDEPVVNMKHSSSDKMEEVVEREGSADINKLSSASERSRNSSPLEISPRVEELEFMSKEKSFELASDEDKGEAIQSFISTVRVASSYRDREDPFRDREDSFRDREDPFRDREDPFRERDVYQPTPRRYSTERLREEFELEDLRTHLLAAPLRSPPIEIHPLTPLYSPIEGRPVAAIYSTPVDSRPLAPVYNTPLYGITENNTSVRPPHSYISQSAPPYHHRGAPFNNRRRGYNGPRGTPRGRFESVRGVIRYDSPRILGIRRGPFRGGSPWW